MDFRVIPAPRTVTGAVTDRETNAPVAGIKVKLTRVVKPGEPVVRDGGRALQS